MKWLLVLVLLAGCSSPEVVNEATSPDTGAVSGVVADASLRPLQAAVSLSGVSELETTTDEEGLFSFQQVEPGQYTLTVRSVGYRDLSQPVDVVANVELEGLVLIPSPDPTFQEPYATDPEVFDGFIECSTVVTTPDTPASDPEYVAVAACDAPGLVGQSIGQDRFMHIFAADEQPYFVQLELVWDATQDASKSLLFEALQAERACEDASGCLGLFEAVTGTDPLVIRLDTSYLGQIGSTHDLAVRVFPFTEDPAPAGVVIQQSFKVFATTFYGYEPPADWLYTESQSIPPP